MDPSGKGIQITYNTSLRRLADLLDGVTRSGGYYSAGALETPMPSLAVKGAGTVSFPVPPAQARELVAAAERAPYGRGDRTLVDEDVRKVWQISPRRLSLRGKGWEKTLQALTAKVAADLGCVPGRVEGELYKLLIYDKGGFFAAHRDTEKAPRMFGTLIVTLPCAHQGGDLVIRHAGREAVVSLRNDDPGEIRYAAFYADCEHEVRPVTRGHRVCLVYNLLHKARSRSPVPPDHRLEIDAAVEVLKAWTKEDHEPRKLVYLLEHHYTQAALSFAALKGADAARAAVLKEAVAPSDCALHLGIVHVEESGWAEYAGYDSSSRRRRSRYWDDDDPEDDEDTSDFDIGEVCDGNYFIDQWRDAADRPVAFGEIPLEEGEVLPAGALDAEKPDQEHFSEATGNEGASFERTYLRAALVLWPQGRTDEVCASAGLDAIIARLGQLITEATAASDSATAAIRKAARMHVLEFASLLPEEWPAYEDHGPRLDALLGHLVRLGDAALIESLLPRAFPRHYAAERNSAVLACAPVLGPARSGAFFTALLAAAAPANPGGCLDLWRGLATGVLSGHRRELEALFEVLVAAAPKVRKPVDQDPRRGWTPFAFLDGEDEFEILAGIGEGGAGSAKKALSPQTLAAFLAALGAELGVAKCIRYLDAIEENPEAFTPETLLLPCLRKLAKGGAAVPAEAVARLWELCAASYLRRSARPPAKPADWAQPVTIKGGGKEPLLRELEAFARDPLARERRFPAPTHERALLHQAIEGAGLDMDHVTERKGRPYTLICTKTRATYERTLRRYQDDLRDIRRLLALPAAKTPEAASTARRLRDALAQ